MTLSGYIVDPQNSGWLMVSRSTKGTAVTTFTGASGIYDLEIHAVAENDGQSTLKLTVDGVLVAVMEYPLSTESRSEFTFLIREVSIRAGADLKLRGTKDKTDAGSAHARLDRIAFVASSNEPAPPPTPETRIVLEAAGTATADFPGPSGTYDLDILAIAEGDGQSTLEVWLGSELIRRFTYPLGTVLRDPVTFELDGLWIDAGEQVTLVGTLDSTGWGTAHARVDKLLFTPGNTANTY